MTGPLPVILDTSVVIAALFRPRSHAGRVLDGVREGRFLLLWSPATRQETERLVRRIPPIEWERVEALYREGGCRPDEGGGDFSSIPDAEDHKFAALARQTGATLVTLDRHLLEVDPAVGVRVATPTAFMAEAE